MKKDTNRDLKFRYLGRIACKLGLKRWYKFHTGTKNTAQMEELQYWKDDILNYLGFQSK